MRGKKRDKKAHLEKANRFIEERRKLKKMCGFKFNQSVALFFNMNDSLLGSNIKFYMGHVVYIFLKQHRNNGRLIFSKPKGAYEFDNDAVDNYIGETWIQIRFEDGENRVYTPENLTRRIIQSNEMIDSNKNFVRGWYTLCSQRKYRLGKITIKGLQYYMKKKEGGNTMVVLDKKNLNVVGEIRETEGEYLLTIERDNNDFEEGEEICIY